MSKYSDGEFQPSYEESIRGIRVFIVCSTFPNSDNLMGVTDDRCCKTARHITAVIPSSVGQGRIEKTSRVPIGAKLTAKLIETAGC
jgi:ribose-phosphate pyrophosphokinase